MKAKPVIAFLRAGSGALSPDESAFQKGLGETDYVEGQNVTIEYHSLDGQYDRLPALVADLLARHVAVVASPAFRADSALELGRQRKFGRKKRSARRSRGPYLLVRHIHGEHSMNFRISGLPAEKFRHLFELSDQELAAQGAVRRIADARNPGYPCRISLTDSNEGDELLLVNYEHHPVDSPYRMRFAVYVRKGEETYDAVDQVPEQLRIRELAVRSFDRNGMLVGWELIDGRKLELAIEHFFAEPRSVYLHVHYAAPGCYAARIDRA